MTRLSVNEPPGRPLGTELASSGIELYEDGRACYLCAMSDYVPAEPAGAADDDAVSAVVERAHSDQVSLIRFLYADHGGIIRGKAASAAMLPARLRTGIGHTVAMMAMSMLDSLQPVDGMGPVGEVRIMPDPATYVALPYAPGAGVMLADLVQPDGAPWDGCARTFLKQAVAELAAEGYAVTRRSSPSSPWAAGKPIRAAARTGSSLWTTACATPPPGSALAHDFAMDLLGALHAQGLQVEHYYPELGHGQQEMTSGMPPRCAPPTTTCCTGRRCAASRSAAGCGPASRPSPCPTRPATAPTCTSRSPTSGRTASRDARFDDPGDQYSLSATGYHFIGGLLAHLPALVALTCGSVNSYRRLAPQMWSSAFTVYGMDNREAAVRICSPMSDDRASSVNLELKPSDSSGNPYLALGAVIHAGLDGIRRKLDPGEAVNVDPAVLTDAERRPVAVHRLPDSLGAALDALEADTLLMGPSGRPAPPSLPGGEALRGGGLRGHDAPGVLRALHQDLIPVTCLGAGRPGSGPPS